MEEEKKYTTAEDFKLPSNGAIYDKAVNPYVRLSSMTMRDEMKRTGKTNMQYKVLAEIIESHMLEKPAISVYDMHVGDFEYLLHKLRVVTHGEQYHMTVMCPFCGKIEDITTNLDKEEVIEFNEKEFNEAKTITLPKSGKVVTLKYQTPRILDNIKLKAADLASKSDSNLDFEFFVKIKEGIDLVDNQKLSYVQLEEFVDKLDSADANVIDQAIDQLNKMVGLKNEIRYTCGKCKEDVLTFFRYGNEFFRPAIHK